MAAGALRFANAGRPLRTFWLTLGERPPGTTLGRIGNSKGYYPLNCRWETRQEQNGNTRQAHLLCHDGQVDTMTGWAKRLGLSRSTIAKRIRNGWAYDQLFSRPELEESRRRTLNPLPSGP
jgi:hypothetical protein